MIENNETTQQEAQPVKPGGISKVVWIAGCGCLLTLVVIVAGLLAYFYFFRGGDPIAKVVPADSMVYITTDLTKTQSARFIEIVNIFQEIADEKVQTPTEMLDETLKKELDMNFADNIVPWIGTHSAFVITDGDFESGDVQVMFIIETINKGNADEFIVQLTEALDKKQARKFEQAEREGITIYTSKSSSQADDIVITRSGKFIYISNSEDTIFESIKLPKADSLSSSENYKATLAALPKDRFSTIYVNGDKYFEILQSMAASSVSTLQFDQSLYGGLAGIGLAFSVEEAGLRMDAVTVMDAEKVGEFQKNNLNAILSAPTTDAMVPGDTFLWFGVNSSQNIGDFMNEDSPLYTADAKEAFKLLEQQYNVDIPKLFSTFGGELAMAVGPASDGLMAESGGTNMGLTIIADVTDEQGFNDWFDDLVTVASTQMGTELNIEKVTIGSYNLQEITIEAGMPAPSTILLYGASNSYGFLSSSRNMLENGLNGEKTLAINETYINTWQVFPSDSIPYMYLDMSGLMDLIVESAGSSSEMRDMQNKLEKIPVIALSINKPSTYVQNVTMIAFMETKLK